MYVHDVVKIYLNLAYSSKLGNAKFGIVNQHYRNPSLGLATKARAYKGKAWESHFMFPGD
jgi:hypothetical protein